MIIYSHVFPPATSTTVHSVGTDIEGMMKLHATCIITIGGCSGTMDGSIYFLMLQYV